MYLIITWNDGARKSVQCADIKDAISTLCNIINANPQAVGGDFRVGKNGDRVIYAIPRDSAEPLKMVGVYG